MQTDITITGHSKNKEYIAYEWTIDKNYLSHIFFPHENIFVVSKFLTNFLKTYPEYNENFSLEIFVKTQINLLSKIEYFKEIKNIIVNENNISETLALIIFWDILLHYTSLIWDTFFENNLIWISWNSILLNKYFEFKKNLIEEISYLPTDLARDIYTLNNQSYWDWVKLEELLKFKNKPTTEYELKYYPKRKHVRFFLYHFFEFSLFSEERKDTVNLWTIFEPDKYSIWEKWWANFKKWGQYDIIASILQNKNTLWVMSTWSWKSITFLLSGMIKPWTTFIIAPLKSLIEDQFFNLEKKHLLADLTWKIHSWLWKSDKENTIKDMEIGKYKFLYCSPERLQTKSFIKAIWISLNPTTSQWLNINQFVVDEAHCLSERWHDFRFSYLNLKLFKIYLDKNKTANIPFIWLTATASEIVKKDIVSYLWIENVIEESTLNRQNISMQIVEVENPEDKPKKIADILNNDIDRILSNVAAHKGVVKHPIKFKDNNWYENWGIVFTIYWEIWGKTQEWSKAQCAEYLWQYLSENYADDPNLTWLFVWWKPEFEIATCPICWSLEIIQSKELKERQQKKFKITEKYWLTYDFASDKFIDSVYTTNNFQKNIFSNENFFVCNNKACWRRSDDEEMNWWYCKPLIKTVIREDPNDEEHENERWWEKIKLQIQDKFKKNSIWLLVSTKWFWMWIDKPNIRYIIHSTLSWSLESYYQEIWRAWRDGEHSHTILLFSKPFDECKKDSNLFVDKPKCIKDPKSFQYQKCPYKDWNSMCDVARQWKMMTSPIVLKEKVKEKNSKKEYNDVFLHDYLSVTEKELYSTEIITDKGIKSLEDLVYWNKSLQWGFSHPLIEFWQLYLFYKNSILDKNNKIIDDELVIERTKSYNWESDDANKWIEKLIYRLMCAWILTHYYIEYKWLTAVIFHLHINENYSTNLVDNYCREKLDTWNIDLNQAFELPVSEWFNDNFRDWLRKQDDVVKSFWKLIYWTYDKVEKQRKQLLMNLYESISATTDWHECFRYNILKRLTEAKKESDELNKCNFCSWCVEDVTKFSETEWSLPDDIEIKMINSLIKKKRRWEQLSEQEESMIEKYNVWISIENKIRELFDQIDITNSFDSTTAFIDFIESEKYNVIPMIQRKLESWTFNPWYYFLAWYLTNDNIRRRDYISTFYEYITQWDNNCDELMFKIGQFLASKNNDRSKSLYEEMKNNINFSNFSTSLNMWFISIISWLSDDKLEKLLYLLLCSNK